MRTSDTRFSSHLLETHRESRSIRLDLPEDEAASVAVALERLGCTVSRSTLDGRIRITPPTIRQAA